MNEEKSEERKDVNVKHGNPFTAAFKGTIGKGCGCVTLILLAIIFFAVMAGGGDKKKEDAVTQQQPAKIKEEAVEEVADQEPAVEETELEEKKEPFKINGVGQQATEKFTLNKGLAVFKMTHNGSSNFSVKLLDEQGDYIDLLVNEIGSFEGSKAVKIPQNGIYLLDIQADGSWTIIIE